MALQVGDRCEVRVPNRKPRLAIIKGEGRTGQWWNVQYDGMSTKSVNGIAKTYCHAIEISRATSNEPD